MNPQASPGARRQQAPAAPVAHKKCSGPCGQRLPLSAFSMAAGRRDGRRSDCKECRRARRGPRGKEGQQARALANEIWVLRETYTSPALKEILSRAYEEIQQVGAGGARFDEQVRAVRRAVEVGGCRDVDEVMEDTQLSRYSVARALEKLVADKVLETRDRFLLADEEAEPGRPVTEYHPTDSPRGEVFTHLLHRRAVDDDLL